MLERFRFRKNAASSSSSKTQDTVTAMDLKGADSDSRNVVEKNQGDRTDQSLSEVRVAENKSVVNDTQFETDSIEDVSSSSGEHSRRYVAVATNYEDFEENELSNVSSDVISLGSRHSETNELPATKKRKQMVRHKTSNKCSQYKVKFRLEWLQEFNWLWNSRPDTKNGESFCIACGKTLKGGYSHLTRHHKNSSHKENFKAKSGTPSILSVLKTQGQEDEAKTSKITELKCVAFIAEHNLPISIMDHLPKFLKSVCPDSKYVRNVKCARTKSSKIFKDIFSKENLSELSKIMITQPFSLIIDETTDISISKSLVVVVRFFDSYRVKDHFFALLELDSATALSITDKILNLLKVHNIPITNLVGFAADNASVMMGRISGVQARLKEYVPNLFILGCSCHSFHLCASAACLKLPRALEQLTRDIYNHFSNSSERYNRLKEFQEFVNTKPNKILRPSQTRWLSLKQVIDKILLNWDALLLYFQGIVLLDKKKTHLQSTENILNALQSPVYKIYFLFLKYALDMLTKMNLEFQTEKSRITYLHDHVCYYYRAILKCFVNVDYLNSVPLGAVDPSEQRYHKNVNFIYFGAAVEEYLETYSDKFSEDDIKSFKHKCLDFYVELSSQIRNRFSFDDGLLKNLGQLNPIVVKSNNPPSLLKILKYFPSFKETVDIEAISMEWRMVSDDSAVDNINDLEDFWSQVCHLKNAVDEYKYPNLRKLILIVLCLPHSSAAAERIFSQLALIKTKVRNRLLLQTCESLLHTKYYVQSKGGECYNFEPNDSILKRNVVYKSDDENCPEPELFIDAS